MLCVLLTNVCYDANTTQLGNKCHFLQAIVCSFVYDGPKSKTKTEVNAIGEQASAVPPNESSSPPPPSDATQNMDPIPEVSRWPPSSPPDARDLNTEIDLAQG